MDENLFNGITQQIKDLGIEEVGVFYIGESFTKPKVLINAVKRLKQELQIPYVFLTSNASLAKVELVEELMKLGIDSIKWSCNAADPQQFEELMGVPAKAWFAAQKNIAEVYFARGIGQYKTTLSASSVKYNEEQVSRMESFLSQNVRPYVDEHYWLPLYTAGGQAREREQTLGMQPIAGNTGRLDDPTEPIPCWTIFTAAHIRVDGHMTACCLDGTGKWDMGDLNRQAFMEAWNSDRFVALRKKHLAKDIIGTLCEKCALVT